MKERHTFNLRNTGFYELKLYDLRGNDYKWLL